MDEALEKALTFPIIWLRLTTKRELFREEYENDPNHENGGKFSWHQENSVFCWTLM